MEKREIIAAVEAAYKNNLNITDKFCRSCSLGDYEYLTYEKSGYKVWTAALRAALSDYDVVIIPASDVPYGIDDTVVIPSGRKISAYGARIILLPDVRVLMFRNEHTENGTHHPISRLNRDRDIMISGGIWEECRSCRLGYGRSGQYDTEYTWKGISALFYFGNADRITLKDVTFRHTAGFSVQCGDVSDIMFDSIYFDECFADGLHINGNTKCCLCRNIRGQVGDDLVALNMYDWQNSSVNFGPTSLVYCDGLEMSPSSRYKAMRIEPGTYYYDNGESVDCSLTDCVISHSRGVSTYKLYYQTPAYSIGTSPEKGAVGSADNIYFDDIDIDLDGPIDGFKEYIESDTIRGVFAAFELGSNIGKISFENIRIKLYPDKYPLSCLISCGPKSCICNNGKTEVFDPYLSSRTDNIILRNITVNNKKADDFHLLIREITFDDINHDGHSSAAGSIGSITVLQ